jgi:hypothetical protein
MREAQGDDSATPELAATWTPPRALSRAEHETVSPVEDPSGRTGWRLTMCPNSRAPCSSYGLGVVSGASRPLGRGRTKSRHAAMLRLARALIDVHYRQHNQHRHARSHAITTEAGYCSWFAHDRRDRPQRGGLDDVLVRAVIVSTDRGRVARCAARRRERIGRESSAASPRRVAREGWRGNIGAAHRRQRLVPPARP